MNYFLNQVFCKVMGYFKCWSHFMHLEINSFSTAVTV
jgi:hypothetical protein